MITLFKTQTKRWMNWLFGSNQPLQKSVQPLPKNLKEEVMSEPLKKPLYKLEEICKVVANCHNTFELRLVTDIMEYLMEEYSVSDFVLIMTLISRRHDFITK